MKYDSTSYYHDDQSCQAFLIELLSSDSTKSQYDFLKSVYLTYKYYFYFNDEKIYKVQINGTKKDQKLIDIFRFSSSTPTFEAIITAKLHMEKIKTQFSNALFSLVVLTDGETNYSRHGGNSSGGSTIVNIEDQKIEFKGREYNGTHSIVKLLKNIKGVYSKSYIFLNFQPKTLQRVLGQMIESQQSVKKVVSDYRKTKTITIDNECGLNRIMAIDTIVRKKTKVNVDDNTSVSQLKKYTSDLTNNSNIKKFFARKISDIIS
jgi:hypothetical protein